MKPLIEKLKKETEAKEEMLLCKVATFSKNTKGRMNPETEDDFRSPYARDRDRIIHSSSFRRLKDKAQVFLLAKNDMIRTRLSHTLEVSQIARTVAKALSLNEELTEAIALGHDLGHTPFGHIGERVLANLCEEWFKEAPTTFQEENLLYENNWVTKVYKNFRHNVQSLRVVDFLENKGKGLNLSYEVREGILYHSKYGGSLTKPNQKITAKTLEGQIVRIADRIAYVNHDLQDAFRNQILSEEDIPKEYFTILGDTHSKRIGNAIISMLEYFDKQGQIGIETIVGEYIDGLYKILTEKIYKSPKMQEESKKAEFVIKELAKYYRENPLFFHQKVKDIEYPQETPLEQKIIDYLANMTDHFILREFENLRLPKDWAGL